MSINIDNILNGTPDKRIQLAYKNFIENFTEEGSEEFKSVYEKENFSDIINNSKFIMKDPFNGIKFYESKIINPQYCAFTAYENELQKVRNIIDLGNDAGIPKEQLSLYESLESKISDILSKTKNIRIITEYVKDKIDPDFEKNLSNNIYSFEKSDITLEDFSSFINSFENHTGVLYTYFPFICESDDIAPVMYEYVMANDGKCWNKIEKNWTDVIESVALMNKFYNDSYYKESINKNIHNADIKFIIGSYIKESPVEKLNSVLTESQMEGNCVIHSTSDGAVMGLLQGMDDEIYKEETEEIRTKTSDYTRFALNLTYDLMNTESAINGREDVKLENYPLYEYFTLDKNPSNLTEGIGKMSEVLVRYESDDPNFFIEADEDNGDSDDTDDTVDNWDNDEEPQSAKNNTPQKEDNKKEEKKPEPQNNQSNNQKIKKSNSGSLFNKIQVGAQDLQAKQMKFMGKVKKVGSDVINAGKAIVQLPMNFVNGIKSEIKKLDTMDDNRRKEYMIEPGFRKKAIKNLKLALLYGSVAQTNLALIPVTMMARHYSKEKDKRIKNELRRDLETEIKICEEKINDANSEGDKEAKYKLMRIKDQLEKELFRINTNSKYI